MDLKCVLSVDAIKFDLQFLKFSSKLESDPVVLIDALKLTASVLIIS